MFQINPWLIASVAIIVFVVFTFVIYRVIRAQRSQASTGWEGLIGKPAVVQVTLAPEGMVLFRGERWTAISEEGTVEPGEEVIINRVDSLKLYVNKKKEGR